MRATNQNIDTMYYHIAVTKGEHRITGMLAAYPFYILNVKEETVEGIVRKYIKKEPFLLKGTHIDLQEYPQMIIVQTRKAVHGFAEDRARALNPLPIFMGPSEADTFFIERRDTEDDVTTSFIERMQKVVDEETHPKVRLADTDVVKNKRVFIVHGHDEAIEVKASQLIKDLGLEPVILHEESDKGQTIIEKLERCTDVGFGIILYTPCDHGGEMGSDSMMPRARQNVVFEHGMLIGKLGRGRVCALLKGDIEKPSDISGIIYKTIDDKGMWRIEVAKELNEAGYDVDMNKLLKINKKM